MSKQIHFDSTEPINAIFSEINKLRDVMELPEDSIVKQQFGPNTGRITAESSTVFPQDPPNIRIPYCYKLQSNRQEYILCTSTSNIRH
eukprot:12566552-Ditylum_brightwellii.AAC.1